MRSNFVVDWAFGIKNAIENVVRTNFPALLRNWPLLSTFNFDGYDLGNGFCVILLKDKLSGIPAGNGNLLPFQFNDILSYKPTNENIELWQNYIRRKFELRNEDVAFILPIYDSNKNNALEDYDLFSNEEKYLWDLQMSYNISLQKRAFDLQEGNKPMYQSGTVYNLYGPNSRVNINSEDSSVNSNGDVISVFKGIREAIENDISIKNKEIIITAVREMESSIGTEMFLGKYKQFISLIADHISIIAPFLPVLSGLLGT